jgi:hypothetical protein
MTHPEPGSLGEEIIKDIMEIADGEQRSPSSIMGVLPQLFDKVVSFIGDALAVRGPNDGVAYWAEQAYEATQRIERRMASLRTVPKISSTSTTTAAATTMNITWASVAARLPPPSQEEATLQQVKARVVNASERTALWTISVDRSFKLTASTSIKCSSRAPIYIH